MKFILYADDTNLFAAHESTLGVLINENLTWSDHISAVLNKTSKNLGIIRKLSKTLPSDILLTLYNTLIASYLDYCNFAWSSRDTIEFKKLFRVKKSITSYYW